LGKGGECRCPSGRHIFTVSKKRRRRAGVLPRPPGTAEEKKVLATQRGIKHACCREVFFGKKVLSQRRKVVFSSMKKQSYGEIE